MQNPGRFLDHGSAARDELVVVLHAFGASTGGLAGVRETVRRLKLAADIFIPPLPYAGFRGIFCLRKAELIVADLVDSIDRLVAIRKNEAGRGYRAITLIGHSIGAVLARKIAIVALGEQRAKGGDRPAPFEPALARFARPRRWAPLLRRIVLLAGMNRGWNVSSAMNWGTTVLWGLLAYAGDVVFRGKPTVFAIRRGAPFLVQTRLQWLALMDPEYGARPKLDVVQLIGSIDDQVAPNDNVDYAVDLFGPRRAYFYLDVPHSSHANVIEMAEAGPEATRKLRAARRNVFELALTATRKQLAENGIPRSHMADSLVPEPDLGVTDVAFVIHGIRDKGFWTQKIARAIKQEAASQKKRRFESITESYGYFAMLPFLSRTVRQRKVEWLMDRFAEARARFPRATFHYVGHSNGTYLAAQALRDYPVARFKHVVFAGSVVRRNYDWLGLIRPKAKPGAMQRVEQVLNYVATRDWVVALFPKGLEPLWLMNLGGAGHDGFKQARAGGPIHEVRFVKGSHGAGHEEPHWDEIARFIVTGKVPPRDNEEYSKTQSPLWRFAGHISPGILAFLAVAIIGFGFYLAWSIFSALPWCPTWFKALTNLRACIENPTPREAAWRAIGLFVYLLTVVFVVTRV